VILKRVPELINSGVRFRKKEHLKIKDTVNNDMLRTVFDAMPMLIFVVDDDVRIQEYNAAAAELLSTQRSAILKHRGGEVLHCLHASEVPKGCGRAPFCKDCVIRNSVAEALQGNRIARRRTRIEMIRDGKKIEIYALVSASPFLYEDRSLVLLVIEDIREIAELKRMIPICSVCKKVRDEKESWFRIEAYFKERWDLDFSHGLCPECFKVEFRELNMESPHKRCKIEKHSV
jgi:PAS domain-containing protein